MIAMMEKYATNLEVLVDERTDQLQEEKKKTGMYLLLAFSWSFWYFYLMFMLFWCCVGIFSSFHKNFGYLDIWYVPSWRGYIFSILV